MQGLQPKTLMAATVAIAALLGASTASQSAPLQINFAGEISGVSRSLLDRSGAGFGMTGSYRYETTTPDFNTGSSSDGEYRGAVSGLGISIGALNLNLRGGSGVSKIRVGNGSRDTFKLGYKSRVDTADGQIAWDFKIILSDLTGTAFSDDSLTTPDLDDFQSAMWMFAYRDEDGQLLTARGTLSELDESPLLANLGINPLVNVIDEKKDGETVSNPPGGGGGDGGEYPSQEVADVPEPASLGLLGLALAGVGLLRRRRRG